MWKQDLGTERNAKMGIVWQFRNKKMGAGCFRLGWVAMRICKSNCIGLVSGLLGYMVSPKSDALRIY